MKNGFFATMLALAAVLPGTASALGIMTLQYEIGPYQHANYSASWFHGADGCAMQGDLDMNGDSSADLLYTCGGNHIQLTGMLSGHWNGTVLSSITGHLNGWPVTGGSLGGAYYDSGMNPLWQLVIEDHGTFAFEDMDGYMNLIDDTRLMLWGQNYVAYNTEDPNCEDCNGEGTDLYGKATPLSSPGTLSLALLGLPIALAMGLRRRTNPASCY